jgi:1,2-diacylglycerol 3-beta-galactosyltransferase
VRRIDNRAVFEVPQILAQILEQARQRTGVVHPVPALSLVDSSSDPSSDRREVVGIARPAGTECPTPSRGCSSVALSKIPKLGRVKRKKKRLIAHWISTEKW